MTGKRSKKLEPPRDWKPGDDLCLWLEPRRSASATLDDATVMLGQIALAARAFGFSVAHVGTWAASSACGMTGG